jgi:antitoxin FitA
MTERFRKLVRSSHTQNACVMMKPMPSLQIRDVPDDVYRALARRAEREGRSLAQQALHELRKMPELVARERRRAVLEELRRRAPDPRLENAPDPVKLIREDRDA